MQPVVFVILLVLAAREMHGYAIGEAVRTGSSGQVRLAIGPSYRHLKKLLDSGLVEEARHTSPTAGELWRRYYRVT